MRRYILVAVATVAAGTASAQNGAARPTVAIQVVVDSATRRDSATFVAAIRRGVEVDSLLAVVERPPQPDQRARGAKFLVSVGFVTIGDRVRADLRVIDVASSTIVHRETLTTTRGEANKAVADGASRAARKVAPSRHTEPAP